MGAILLLVFLPGIATAVVNTAELYEEVVESSSSNGVLAEERVVFVASRERERERGIGLLGGMPNQLRARVAPTSAFTHQLCMHEKELDFVATPAAPLP